MKQLLLFASLFTFLIAADNSIAAEKKSKRSLASISTILVSGNYCAMVPKGAILHTPPHIKGKDAKKLTGTLVNWKTFLRKNSGWIHMHQVSMEQAAGKKKIQPNVIKAYKSMGKMVIAHNFGDLVSVKPKALLHEKE